MHRLRSVALVALTLFCVTCIGDASHDVDIRNATGRDVLVIQHGAGPGRSQSLGAGATIKTAWLWPLSHMDARRRRVEAEDLGGKLIYCREFGFADLESIRWTIELREGELLCHR